LEDTDKTAGQYVLSALKAQTPLPDQIVNALLYQLFKHAGHPSVREYTTEVLGGHLSLPERVLEILASESLNDKRSALREVFWALEKQSFLPRILELLVTYPKGGDTYLESFAVNSL